MKRNTVILQWGNIVKGTNNFPISFSTVAKLSDCGEYSWNQVNKINSISMTQFVASIGTTASNQAPVRQYLASGY